MKNDNRNKMEPASTSPRNADRVSELFRLAIQDISVLSNAYSSVNSAINNKKATETDNTAKLRQVEIDSQKEENRHKERMEELTREWEKVSNSASEKKKRIEIIEKQVDIICEVYRQCLSCKKEDFLSDAVTARLESLNKTMVELTKEINRS